MANVAVSKDTIKTLNPGSARFDDPGEMGVQRMRFELVANGDDVPVYKTGGMSVQLDSMAVIENAAVTLEGDVGADGKLAGNGIQRACISPVIKSIQNTYPNRAIIQLLEDDSVSGIPAELGNDTVLTGEVFVLESEGY